MGGWALLFPIIPFSAMELCNNNLAWTQGGQSKVPRSFMEVDDVSKAWAKCLCGHSGFVGSMFIIFSQSKRYQRAFISMGI